jgi:uncharacterized protein (TIGR03437 family)
MQSRVAQALRAAWQRGHWHHRFGLPDAFHADALKAFPAAAPAAAEAESGTGGGRIMMSSNASGQRTVLLLAGQSLGISLSVATPGLYQVAVRASNDNFGPLETVAVSADGVPLGSFQPPNTHPDGGVSGSGWNVFVDSTLAIPIDLLAGSHVFQFDVTGGDGFGVELDMVRLDPVAGPDVRPWVDRSRFAIDEGPAALALENSRSGLIWTLMRKNANIQRAAGRLLPVQTVSAASGASGAASESLVSSFGAGLPSQGVTISVLDSAGAATVTIRGADAPAATGTLVFSSLAPALFSADSSGQGVAAANLIRVANGGQTLEAVAAFDSITGQTVPVPIRFGDADRQLYLTLYGTGLRGNAGLGGVALRIGGETVPVTYCGAQPAFPGLDQVNAGPLPRALAGRGQAAVDLTVENRHANSVALWFQ